MRFNYKGGHSVETQVSSKHRGAKLNGQRPHSVTLSYIDLVELVSEFDDGGLKDYILRLSVTLNMEAQDG